MRISMTTLLSLVVSSVSWAAEPQKLTPVLQPFVDSNVLAGAWNGEHHALLAAAQGEVPVVSRSSSLDVAMFVVVLGRRASSDGSNCLRNPIWRGMGSHSLTAAGNSADYPRA